MGFYGYADVCIIDYNEKQFMDEYSRVNMSANPFLIQNIFL